MNNQIIVQSMWIGPALSNLEVLSINSFLKNGYAFHLYCYDKIQAIPSGTTLMDARQILPEEDIFFYNDASRSPSGFSNIFRYKLLTEKGGWWVDLDTVLIKPFDFKENYVFAHQDKNLINGAIIKAPIGNILTKQCYEEAIRKEKNTIQWGEIGPRLFTEIIYKNNFQKYILPAVNFYPLIPWHFPQDAKIFIDPEFIVGIYDQIYCIHFFSESWRRQNIDKNGIYHPNSIYEKLKKKYS